MSRLHSFGLILLLVSILSPGWGWAQTINWTKYTNTTPASSDTTSTGGRIPLGSNTRGDDVGALIPTVLRDGSTYKMWYTGYDGATQRIYYATSSNGLEWTKYSNAVPPGTSDTTNWGCGRIPLGSDGKGDATYTWYAAVIKDDSSPIYKMWYSGWTGNGYVFYATSTNGGLTWTKYDNGIPVNSDGSSTNGKIPRGTAGKGDSTYALGPSVIKDGPTDYKMWYAGSASGTICVYYATSSNGLEWAKYDNTIPENSNDSSTNGKIPRGLSGRGDSAGAAFPSVIKDGATYKMWYVGYDAGNTARVYYATSSDGLTWTKLDNTIPPNSDTTNSNGRVGLGTAGKGDYGHASHPKVVISEDGRTYQMWYSGGAGPNWRVYYATYYNPPPPAGTIFTFK